MIAGPAEGRRRRWTVKFAKGRPAADSRPQIDIAIPTFRYKSHISIDRRHGITDAAAHDGARLREGLIDPTNTASDVSAAPASRGSSRSCGCDGSGGRSDQVHGGDVVRRASLVDIEAFVHTFVRANERNFTQPARRSTTAQRARSSQSAFFRTLGSSAGSWRKFLPAENLRRILLHSRWSQCSSGW